MGKPFTIAVIVTALLSCAGCDRPVTVGVKSTSVPFSEIRSHLPLLEARGATLYIEVRERHIGSADLIDLLTEARARGIRVMLWPLLATEEGPWANELNAEPFADLARRFVDWLQGEGLPTEWLVVNMENSAAQMDLIKAYFFGGEYEALLELLLGNLDAEGFARAVEVYRDLVEAMHGRGVQVAVTTYPFMVDDFQDGDTDLQDLANVPLAGIDWDALTFTAYRTAYSGDLGVEFGPAIVYDYGRAAKSLFGDRARLAVGMIGTTSHGEGYTGPEDLALDIAAARAAGIEEVDLFHLAGMLEEGGPAPWLEACAAPPVRPPADPKVTLARLVVQMADLVLDGLR